MMYCMYVTLIVCGGFRNGGSTRVWRAEISIEDLAGPLEAQLEDKQLSRLGNIALEALTCQVTGNGSPLANPEK